MSAIIFFRSRIFLEEYPVASYNSWTPSYEDYDYFVTIPPYQLNTNASIIHFDSELERFADETFLETALPLKENIPVKDFCNLTESLIL